MFGFNQQPAGYGGPVLTRHAQKLQWLAGGQLLVSGLLFVFGIAVLALIVETTEGATVEKSNNYLWSTGLPGNAFMPMISGAMGFIAAFLGRWSIRARRDVKSEALKHGYHIMGIIQLIFFDMACAYYCFLYTRLLGDLDTRTTNEKTLMGMTGFCGALSLVNFILFFISSSINCMCCDPFIDRYPMDMGYNARPRPMMGPMYPPAGTNSYPPMIGY